MPHSRRTALVWFLLCGLTLAACGGAAPSDESPRPGGPARHLLLVLDGLRPDYVTPSLMPALHALGQQGVVMTRHHAVYPTVTRVNASSISTGAYPEVHGLLGNAVFFPGVDSGRFLSTGDRENLLRIEAAGEPLLTAATLGETLAAAGRRMLVMSSGSTGSSYLLNHTVAGGAVLHYEYGLPAVHHEDALARLGPVPEAGTPNHARNRWIVDAFLQVALPAVDPAVTVMWLSDPDTTAHRHGIGHPLTVEALFRLDAEIQRIRDGLADAGVLETTTIWVTSDHGFSEHTGSIDLQALLAPYAGALDDGSPRVVAGEGAIYVRDDDRATVAGIVAALQATEGVGAIFTEAVGPGANEGWAPGTLSLDLARGVTDDRATVAGIVAALQATEGVGAIFTEAVGPGANEGWAPGTLSLDLARWRHDRSAQILYSADWTDAAGEFGFPGTSAQFGVAGHGSSSPFDIHNTLVASGPAVKAGAVVEVPSGNVDFAPTFLHLLGIDPPPLMQGRILREALRDETAPAAGVETSEVTVESADGTYGVTAVVSEVDGRTYLDYTVTRRPAGP